MRRLPIFFVLDCSDSMAGTRIEQMEAVLQAIIRHLRTDPAALEQVYVSVIGFAGVAKTLAPLIELAAFYPPKLPLGSGTHLGEALRLLMQEIDKQVQSATPDRKGDWKPVIYLLTDGQPTDDVESALSQWQSYRYRTQMVAIGLGDDPDYSLLQRFTDQTLSFQGRTEEEFSQFIRWMSQSVQAYSQSVGKNDWQEGQPQPQGGLSLVKADISKADKQEQCVTLTGRCSRTRRPYLIRYEKLRKSGLPDILSKYQPDHLFQLDSAYRLEEDYFRWSDPHGYEGSQINAGDLIGTPACPQCSNPCSFAVCGCGGLLCIGGPESVTCPWCQRLVQFDLNQGGDDNFTVTRSQG